MSESMEKSRQATSGWRRISVAAFSALFAFILARFTLRNRPALPERTSRTAPHDDALDSHIRLRVPVTMASAPPDFTQKVLIRIAASPAPQQQIGLAPRARTSWLHSMRIFGVTVGIALLLMLATGVVLTLVNPTLAVAILDAVISAAVAVLAFGRMIGRFIGNAAATPWMIPAAMGALLGFLLLSFAQLARQFGRDPQEA
jgi:hypothetical protein